MKVLPHQIGFDFDGVIADIGEAFLRIACETYGYCSINLNDITSFQVENCIDIPIGIVEEIFDTILRDSLGTGLKPLPGAIESLSLLSSHSDITIITARPELQPVTDWFDYYCAAEARVKIRLIATGDHDNKEQYIKSCGLTHFIDDRTLTCLQLAEAGLYPIVFSQPWNRNQHNLPTVAGWEEVLQLIDINAMEPN